MFGLLKKIFGTAQDRTVGRYKKIVEEVNRWDKQFQSLSDEQLRQKTAEFRERYKRGENLDQLLPEAFAVVKGACRRLIGTEVHVSGYNQKWDMVPYDVQIVGAIALHKGSIAEMQTGEGKTLTSVLPLYLNALTGEPVHLVTVNDGEDEQLLKAFSGFRLLTPMRKGPFGVEHLNELFLRQAKKNASPECFVTPIMIVQNDYRSQLFNGEVGVLVEKHSTRYALFASGNTIRKIPAFTLPAYEYAYCLSVHKSQGSEFEKVAVLLPKGAEAFGREVLYTAATRARHHLELIAAESTLRHLIAKESNNDLRAKP